MTTRPRSRSSSRRLQIFNTFPIPPDFATFWRQAAQQGYQQSRSSRSRRRACSRRRSKRSGDRPQHGQRGLLGADVAIQVVVDRSHVQADSPRANEADEKQWNQQPGPSLALFDVAAARDQGGGRPEGQEAVAPRCGSSGRDAASASLNWGNGPERERGRDADPRRPVDEGEVGPVQAGLLVRRELRGPERPDRCEAPPYSV